MSELIASSMNSDVRGDPSVLSNLIIDVAKDIDECRSDLTNIRDRSAFKRMFSNNTRDVAKILIKQSDTMSTFLNIIKAIIFLNMNNIVVLAGILEKLGDFEGERGLEGNQYIQMAKEFLQEAIDGATRHKKLVEEQIEKIMSGLEEKTQIDDEQNNLIDDLEKQMIEKAELDKRQSQSIDNLVRKLQDKDKLDSKQEEQIAGILSLLKDKDKIDAKQDEALASIRNFLIKSKATQQTTERKIRRQFSLYISRERIRKKRARFQNVSIISNIIMTLALFLTIILIYQ